jgi:hypothetical protein
MLAGDGGFGSQSDLGKGSTTKDLGLDGGNAATPRALWRVERVGVREHGRIGRVAIVENGDAEHGAFTLVQRNGVHLEERFSEREGLVDADASGVDDWLARRVVVARDKDVRAGG